jgi:hypothetical protein
MIILQVCIIIGLGFMMRNLGGLLAKIRLVLVAVMLILSIMLAEIRRILLIH